jgi:hypothetical protein
MYLHISIQLSPDIITRQLVNRDSFYCLVTHPTKANAMLNKSLSPSTKQIYLLRFICLNSQKDLTVDNSQKDLTVPSTTSTTGCTSQYMQSMQNDRNAPHQPLRPVNAQPNKTQSSELQLFIFLEASHT